MWVIKRDNEIIFSGPNALSLIRFIRDNNIDAKTVKIEKIDDADST